MVNIYVKRNGKYEIVEPNVKDDEKMQKIMKRLLMMDVPPNSILICDEWKLSTRKFEKIVGGE